MLVYKRVWFMVDILTYYSYYKRYLQQQAGGAPSCIIQVFFMVTGKLEPESPMILVDQFRVSGYDFPVKTNPL